MPLQKYIFNPGINKEGTDYAAEGGWFDSNLVRFRKGLPEKIGGWQKYIETSYEGTGRKLHGWVDLDGTKLLGLGTRFKLYIQEGTSYNDITPIRATTSAGDVTFSATDGSSTLTVTDSGHGAVEGDFVTFSGAASLGGNFTAAVLNQEYQVVSVPTANTFTIVAKDTSGTEVTANSSDTGNGGSSVVGTYQINSGLDVFVDGTGWGVGTWGSGTWGSTTSLGDANQLRLWSMDNFGEDLISNPRAGSIYYWDKTNGLNTRAVALSSLAGANKAPTKGLQVLVSDIDRHVIVLGADPISGGSRSGTIDPLLVAFSDQENAAEWEPLATNTAGSLRCSAGSEIIGGVRARQETLIWTDVALYSLQFIGPPNTFGLVLLNEGVSLIGPNAAVNTPNGIFWMDKKGFYLYNGSVQPLPCTVQAFVFDNLNEGQAFQVFGFVNKQFDEVGWFYCSGENTVIDKYVAYNYVESSWTIGELSRTAWLDEGLVSFPRAAGKSSDTPYLYSHETGFDDDGSPMNNVFIESADFDIGDGEEFQFIRRFIPDVKFTGNSSGTQKINLVLKARNFPGQTLTTDQTSSFTATTTKVDTRARGRQAAVRFESDDDAETVDRLGVGFRIGATRLDVQPNGRR
tara:strand:+ start:554 stop:2437 length:1884 start_codon:yes stop_codon:yes gene_type:complete